MLEFVQRYTGLVIGVLSGFDRLLFRGTQRMLSNARGLMNYLWAVQVPLTRFGAWSEELTQQIRQASEQVMLDAQRPIQYLSDSRISKEDLAREIAQRDRITSGPICLLKAVEPCWSYELVRNRQKKTLDLEPRYRKCLHLYHYQMDKQLGLLHVRLQTWLPFSVRVCLNGREWLCRTLDRKGIGYERRDNCLTWVSDIEKAQELLDGQLKTDWPSLLHKLERAANPMGAKLLRFEGEPLEHYWSVDQSEWATDLMFKDAKSLSGLYPLLVRQGMLGMGSADVLRFLGHRVRADGGVPLNCNKEVMTDLKERPEGIRLKHRAGSNSIKMYDKQGSVLRVESTINDAGQFKVYRGTEAEPEKKQWRKMRKGIADLHRRAEVSQACNERYLSHLAKAQTDARFGQVLCPLERAITRDGRRFRGLRLLSEDDSKLLAAVSRGEFTVNGFRNEDIRKDLFGADPRDKDKLRKLSGRVSRKLAMLHAHGLIKKVPRTRRWLLTDKGKEATTLLAAANNASAKKLLEIT